MESYTYSPLKSFRSTRLFQLLPGGSSNDEIHGRLLEIDLNDALKPGYTALSYCWGSQSRDATILLDDRPLPVTTNLLAALLALRSRDATTLLWIDAICINQDDLVERSAQVQHMRRIFESASRVSIWLGPKTAEISAAMDLIRSTYNRTLAEMTPDLDLKDVVSETIERSQDLIFPSRRDSCEPENLVGLRQMLSRPWFTRVWVIQEVSVPDREIVMYCGNDFVQWEAFIALIEPLSQKVRSPEWQSHGIAPFDKQSLRRLFNLERQRIHRKSGAEGVGPLETLARYRHFESSDPRDKIYALRGLMAGLSGDDLLADYSLSNQATFARVAEYFILVKGSFECLGYCMFTGRDPTIPSWAYDWSGRDTRHPLAKWENHDLRSRLPVYKAMTGMSHRRKCIVKSGQVLSVDGFKIDNVSRITYFEMPQLTKGSIEPHHPVGTYALFGVEFGDSETYRNSSENMKEAYCRTVVADIAKSGIIRKRGFGITLSYWNQVQQYLTIPADPGYRTEWGSLLFSIVGRCLFWSEDGYIGLAPDDIQPGDQICAFFGGDVLYMLRPTGDSNFLFIGECYVHGLMDGEAEDILRQEGTTVETFDIV